MASQLILFPYIPILQYLILLILIQISPYVSSFDYYKDCTKLFSCGDIQNIGFPFWGGDRPEWCGHPLLQVTCEKNVSYIKIKDVKYQVLEANPNGNTLRISRDDYLNLQGLCPSTKLVNTTLDTELFVYGSDYKNLTLFYGCSSNAFPSTATTGFLPCIPNEASGDHVYTQFGSLAPPVFCKASVVLAVSPSLVDINNFNRIQEAIRGGFVVRWTAGIEECNKCRKSGAVCGYDWISNQTKCYTPDANSPPSQSLEPSPEGMFKIIAN